MKPDFKQLLEDNPGIKFINTSLGEDTQKYFDMCNAINEAYFPKNRPLLKMDEIITTTITHNPDGSFTITYK